MIPRGCQTGGAPVSQGLVCWKCGASIAHLSLPLSRFDECRSCRAALHACRLCEFYSTTVAKHCREPIAEEVKDKELANFCDYFKPREGAHTPPNKQEVEQARAALEALFGPKR
jgi:hypothetical protein